MGTDQDDVVVRVRRRDDLRRCRIIREEIGLDRRLMMDANQVWDVEQAIAHMTRLAPFRPYWIEEPTSPDDVLGHAAIARALEPFNIGVALRDKGDLDEAIAAFKEAVRLDPKNTKAQSDLDRTVKLKAERDGKEPH